MMSHQRLTRDYIQLCEAIQMKDKIKARDLIHNNVNVNLNARGNTPLHCAIIRFDDLDIMTMLLDRGANVHAKDYYDNTPLDLAIQCKKTEAASLLIRRGALVGINLDSLLLKAINDNYHAIVDILIGYGMQYNPSVDLKFYLNAAISHGNSKVIELIIPHCQFLQPSDQYIPRELVMKCGPQYGECVELLLKWNFTINPFSYHDKDFVYKAVEKGYLQIVLHLLTMGIDVNMINANTGLNLLAIACLNKHHEIVEHLLQHGACVNVTIPAKNQILNNQPSFHHNIRLFNRLLSLVYCENNLCDVTCLHIAVFNSDLKMTELLLRFYVKIINDPTFMKLTCIAVRNNCEEIVRLFLDNGVDGNFIDPQERTLLHICVYADSDGKDSRYNIAKLLLEKEANIHLQTPGNDLLYRAINNEHYKIAQLFLQYNANIDAVDHEGQTLLFTACNTINYTAVKWLLDNHANPNVTNKNGQTPLHIACRNKCDTTAKIRQLLLEHNANVEAVDADGWTPLFIACEADNYDAIKGLLDNNANPNATNIHGRTPLHLIYKYESNIIPNIIKLLLEHNANIEAVDKNGWTPLSLACDRGNGAIVKCLLDNHANINHTDSHNRSPLHVAAYNSKHITEVVNILLEHKVNIHCVDKWRNSIIHLIVSNNKAETIKCFAHTAVNFNCVNKGGNTPLHIAVKHNSVKMTRALLKFGADFNILDKNNQTALQKATEKFFVSNVNDQVGWRNTQIVEILITQVIKLKAAGLKVNDRNLNIDFNHNKVKAMINVQELNAKCEQEIKMMKRESIGNTGMTDNITFCDLLQKNIHFLNRFVENEKVQHTLELEVYNKKFPLYIDIVRNRFREAKVQYRLMNPAREYFRLNINQLLPDHCIDTLLSYLSIEELNVFIKAMKPLSDYSVYVKFQKINQCLLKCSGCGTSGIMKKNC